MPLTVNVVLPNIYRLYNGNTGIVYGYFSEYSSLNSIRDWVIKGIKESTISLPLNDPHSCSVMSVYQSWTLSIVGDADALELSIEKINIEH